MVTNIVTLGPHPANRANRLILNKINHLTLFWSNFGTLASHLHCLGLCRDTAIS